jgi:hypothetical protein
MNKSRWHVHAGLHRGNSCRVRGIYSQKNWLVNLMMTQSKFKEFFEATLNGSQKEM